MKDTKIKPGKRNVYQWLLLSLGIALVIQIVGVAVLDPIDPYDSKEYLSISGSLFNGKGYAVTGTSFKGFESFQGETPTRMRQPGYPLYLILFYWLLGENTLALQFSQIVLNTLTLYLMFLIAGKTFGQRLWAGTLIGLALYFPLWLTSAFVLTEALFIFLLVLSMFLLQSAIYSEKNIGRFVISGALFGLAFLTRPIALPICFLSFFPIWLHQGLRKALLYWGVLLLTFLSVLFPWVLRNAIVLSDYTPLSTEGGYNLWSASTPENELKWFGSPEFRAAVKEGYYIDREANGRFTKMTITHIKSDPIDSLKRGLFRTIWTWSYFPGSRLYRSNTLIFGLFSLIQFAILVFAMLGLSMIDKTKVAYFLLPVVSLSCVLVLTKGKSRFIVPAMPFVIVLSVQGFWLLGQRLFKIASSKND